MLTSGHDGQQVWATDLTRGRRPSRHCPRHECAGRLAWCRPGLSSEGPMATGTSSRGPSTCSSLARYRQGAQECAAQWVVHGWSSGCAAQCVVHGRCSGDGRGSGCAVQCAWPSEPSTYGSLGQGAQHSVLRTADVVGTQHRVLCTGNASRMADNVTNAVRRKSQCRSGARLKDSCLGRGFEREEQRLSQVSDSASRFQR